MRSAAPALALLLACCGGSDVEVKLVSATCTFFATGAGQDQYEVHWTASASGPASSFLTGDSVPCASCTGSDSTFTCRGWSVYDPHTCMRHSEDPDQTTLEADERDLLVAAGSAAPSVTVTAYAWGAGASYATALQASSDVTCAHP